MDYEIVWIDKTTRQERRTRPAFTEAEALGYAQFLTVIESTPHAIDSTRKEKTT